MIIENLTKEKQSTVLEQILYNRGITNFEEYTNAVYGLNPPVSPHLLTGAKEAAELIIGRLRSLEHSNKIIFNIVDSDCDGFTSSAFFFNFCVDYFGDWLKDRFRFKFHEGKQHGLSDCIDTIMANKDKIALVCVPDAGSNDVVELKQLEAANIPCVVIDHHEVENKDIDYEDYIVICNNQLGEYPNRDFSGVGVVWQVCRYILELMDAPSLNFANRYLDIVALGNTGDMMSLKSLETRSIITRGFQDIYTINNPFIKGMASKQAYSLSKGDYQSEYMAITPMGASFFIVPFVNAICRSGTLEEKQIVFTSMLEAYANTKVPSTKRGHKPGDTETILEQALRICTNVKNRQTKAETAGMELLTSLVPKVQGLHFLPFILEQGKIEPGIAGLVANKMMAKYQCPVFVLTHNGDCYSGSARGYSKSGIDSFKDLCAATNEIEFAMGHANAFGLSVKQDKINDFIQKLEELMPKGNTDIIYYVDYIFNSNTIDRDIVLDLARMNNFIGQDFERPYIAIKNLTVNKDKIQLMKNNTLKINTDSDIPIIQFAAPEVEIETFNIDTSININVICKCCINEWQGEQYPQLQLVDYEIAENMFWGF